MYSEEEPELRDLIVQNLENCGFLNKIKAELRAGVFLAFEEDGNLRDKIPLFNKKLDDYLSTSEGKLMLSLVREFLEFFNLSFTLSVFDPEVALPTPFVSRSELCDNLKLKTAEINGPIISALLKDVIGDQMRNSISKSTLESKIVPEKHFSISNETVTEKIPMDNALNRKNIDLDEQISIFQKKLVSDHTNKNSKEEIKDNLNNESSLQENVLSNVTSRTFTNIPVEANNEAKKDIQDKIFKEPKDAFSLDHDPFFDEPVPSEKTSFFSFSDPLTDKTEIKLTSSIGSDLEDSKKNSLSSLRNLPSLSANNSWTFSRDSKDNHPSLDILKSFSVSESIDKKEENLDSEGILGKKDSDVTESNEESSEKQNSEESIEEEIDEDFSAGMDDLLNSSLSLGDDITTDQTVSQVSVVEGVDHVEPCNS